MFKQPQSSVLVERHIDEGVDEPLDIRTILETCKFLPTVVAQARLTSVVERLVDQGLLDALTSDSACSNSASDWHGRSKRREEALSRYLGQVLICVFIRLPGVHYTIEIDPEVRRVIHCEWQEI
tara:strand:- start:592 stop:963 length:372 start_codon:yes stop_codon:yes gene_type:complete